MGGSDEEDPLCLFTGSRTDACLGEWKNDRISVVIRGAGGALVLESSLKEMFLEEETGSSESNRWSVFDRARPAVQVYLATVSGYGRDTRLTLSPPAQKSDAHSVRAVLLERAEHFGADEASAQRGRGQLRLCDAAHVEAADCRESRERGAWRSVPGRPRRRGHCQSRSRSRSRSPSGSWRPRSRSSRPRSVGRCRRSPGFGRGGEEITTLFLTGLPEDARESQVRQDCERTGGVVLKLVLMRRERNAFVRFASLADMLRARDRLAEGDDVCGAKVHVEIARRNTN